MKTFRSLLGPGLAFLFACSALQAENWGHYQHDNAHTGRTNAAITPAKLKLAWSEPNYTGALIFGDTLYAKSYHGLSTGVSAFSAADGLLKWTYRGSDIYFGSMSIAGEFVVLEGFDFASAFTDTLTVLDRTTGEFRYRLPLPFDFALLDFTLTREADTGKVIAYCSNGGTLLKIMLDENAGQILWMQSGDLGSSSVPAIVGNSVIVFGYGNAYAFDQMTGAKNNFFVDTSSNLNGGTPISYNAARGEIYAKVDYMDEGVTKVRAFRYNSNDSIDLLWTRTTRFNQFGGGVTIGPDDNLYVVGSGEIAILDPDDGSTLRSIPFPYANSCSPVISPRVLWVYSETQTFAYDSVTLDLLRIFHGSAGFNQGFASMGAFTPGMAALNISHSDNFSLDVYRQ